MEKRVLQTYSTWAIMVAMAVPCTPMWKTTIKSISRKIFRIDEEMRKTRGMMNIVEYRQRCQ